MPTSAGRPHRHPDVTSVELVGGHERRELALVPHDARWPERFEQHRVTIAHALGSVALRIEHIGSTSVPGLAAKPIIDILVTVDDITAEEDYLAALVDAGYELRVREPGHRMVRTPARDTHVHVLQDDAAEAAEYLLLRDRLRCSDADRTLYEATKRSLIDHDWADMNAYAEAKTAVITDIMSRSRS